MSQQAEEAPRGGRYDPTRSVRISDEVWEAARQRASRDGMSMSRALALLAEGYAAGEVSISQVVTSM